jgi:arginyl-tRNA synthetase
MIHIETKSAAEAAARKKYANANDSVAVASDELAAKVADLLAIRHKMDEDELLKSKKMAEIMEEMKEATVLKDKNGKVIVTWKKASVKAKVNYKGLLKKLKAKEADIVEFTKLEAGARTFEIIESQEERDKVIAEMKELEEKEREESAK